MAPSRSGPTSNPFSNSNRRCKPLFQQFQQEYHLIGPDCLGLGHVSISQPITMAWGMQWSDWPDQGHVPTPGAEGQEGSILRKVKVQLSAEGWWVLARQNQWMFTADYKRLESRDLLLYIFLSARQPGTVVGEQYWLSYWRLWHMPYETF